MAVVSAIVLAAIIVGSFIWTVKHRHELPEVPRTARLGHGWILRYMTPEEQAAQARKARGDVSPTGKRRGRVHMDMPVALDENDLEEIDGMFGSAGSRPEDY